MPNTKLKDHAFFEYQGSYYFVATSIALPAPDERGEYAFAYARTDDFCTWENLGLILGPGEEGSADESYIWAPHVLRQGDTYYLFYTGVNRHIAQSVMVATTTDPADPQSWQRRGVVFRPNHPGMIYPGPDHWADARDPMVLEYDGYYLLYYTGLDVTGGIVGVAKAASPLGPWQDQGAALSSDSEIMLESPFVVPYYGYYYIYVNEATKGPKWHWSASPFGPWTFAGEETVGWAHDFGLAGERWQASFVLGNGEAVGVLPLVWEAGLPPQPTLGTRLFLPSVLMLEAGE